MNPRVTLMTTGPQHPDTDLIVHSPSPWLWFLLSLWLQTLHWPWLSGWPWHTFWPWFWTWSFLWPEAHTHRDSDPEPHNQACLWSSSWHKTWSWPSLTSLWPQPYPHPEPDSLCHHELLNQYLDPFQSLILTLILIMTWALMWALPSSGWVCIWNLVQLYSGFIKIPCNSRMYFW